MSDRFDTHELQAFVDDELDLARRLAIEQRLEVDRQARHETDELRQLRAAVRDGAEYHRAPESLRRRLVGLATAPAEPAARQPIGTPGRNARTWRPVAIACTVVLAASVGLQALLAGQAEDARLRDDVVASHVRSTIGDRLVDVASSDHHAVKPWLSSKLDYSPPVRDTQLGDAVFVGARVDYLDGRPVAALVYRMGAHPLDAYVWPTTSRDRDATFSIERGFQVAHWVRGGMTWWAISDVNATEFARFVRLLDVPDGDR